MRTLVLLLVFIISISVKAQDYKLLKTLNGVEINYKSTKIKEEEKKDSWVVEIEYTNKTGQDIYYKELPAEDRDSKPTHYFGMVDISNAKIISFNNDRNAQLAGEVTKLQTDKGEKIYKILKNKTYSITMRFRAEKGIEPILIAKSVNNINFTTELNSFL